MMSNSEIQPTKILVLDNRRERGEKIRKKIKLLYPNCEVQHKLAISREAFESIGFEIAIVHRSNLETPEILKLWNRDNVHLIVFSGGHEDERPTLQQNATIVGDEYLSDNLEEVLAFPA